MANEIITTAITTFYRVDLNDNLYIAPTGSIRTTSGTAALANNLATDTQIDLVIDGSVIAMTGPAISLISATSSTGGFDTILIGAGGLLRSVSGDGVVLSRSNEIVTNHGSIFANPSSESGVQITGNSSSVNNSGTISAGIAVDLNGTNNSLSNSGLLQGRIGVQLVGGVTTVSNTGSIQAEDQQGVIQSGFTTTSLYNSGTIVSNRGDAIQATTTSTTASYQLTNLGRIHGGGGFGVEIGYAAAANPSATMSLTNSGEISGALGAIAVTGGVNFFGFRITNMETGIISTDSKNPAIEFSGFLRLVNDGTIVSGASGLFDEATIHSTGSAGLRLVNTGTIFSHADAINVGFFQANAGTLTLHNHGDISGRVLGGNGANRVVNFGTMDAIVFGSGNDVLRNHDFIAGDVNLGNGSDLFDTRNGYTDGVVRAGVGTGNDTFLGGLGDDTFHSSDGNDLLIGGAGNDVLMGGLGSDRINGGAGDDLIKADFDFDTPTGGAASPDILIGGEGADIFEFRNAAYIGNTAATRDRIVDFAVNTDKIDLSDFMAGASFVGGAAFVASGFGQVRFAAGAGVLAGDVNGDGVTDWQIGMTANLALTTVDFIF